MLHFSFLQMEELELRKEIEAKRKREGKWVEPKLTPKQKEALAGTFFTKAFYGKMQYIMPKFPRSHQLCSYFKICAQLSNNVLFARFASSFEATIQIEKLQ